MTVLSINLTSQLAEFVDANVPAGAFDTPSDVVREALHLLEQRQREDNPKLETLRQAIAVGREGAANGRTVTVAAEYAHLQMRIGEFLPDPEDRWWDLDAATKPGDVLDELGPLLDQAARYLVEHAIDARLIALWEAGGHPA
jgi:antitoxin ParD1/3/4